MELTESQIERKVCKWAKEQEVRVFKFVSPGNRGVPDRMFLGPFGCIAFIEFKKPGGKLSAVQTVTIAEMQRSLAKVCVCETAESAITFLKKSLVLYK